MLGQLQSMKSLITPRNRENSARLSDHTGSTNRLFPLPHGLLHMRKKYPEKLGPDGQALPDPWGGDRKGRGRKEQDMLWGSGLLLH